MTIVIRLGRKKNTRWQITKVISRDPDGMAHTITHLNMVYEKRFMDIDREDSFAQKIIDKCELEADESFDSSIKRDEINKYHEDEFKVGLL